jgi:hypothetical protein
MISFPSVRFRWNLFHLLKSSLDFKAAVASEALISKITRKLVDPYEGQKKELENC